MNKTFGIREHDIDDIYATILEISREAKKLNDNMQKKKTAVEEIEKTIGSDLKKAIQDVFSVREELNKIASSANGSAQIILKSVEYQELLSEIKILIKDSVTKISTEVVKELKESRSNEKTEFKQLVISLKRAERENRILKMELKKVTKDTIKAREEIFVVSKYLSEFVRLFEEHEIQTKLKQYQEYAKKQLSKDKQQKNTLKKTQNNTAPVSKEQTKEKTSSSKRDNSTKNLPKEKKSLFSAFSFFKKKQ